jgi:hypothetical protein
MVNVTMEVELNNGLLEYTVSFDGSMLEKIPFCVCACVSAGGGGVGANSCCWLEWLQHEHMVGRTHHPFVEHPVSDEPHPTPSPRSFAPLLHTANGDISLWDYTIEVANIKTTATTTQVADTAARQLVGLYPAGTDGSAVYFAAHDPAHIMKVLPFSSTLCLHVDISSFTREFFSSMGLLLPNSCVTTCSYHTPGGHTP